MTINTLKNECELIYNPSVDYTTGQATYDATHAIACVCKIPAMIRDKILTVKCIIRVVTTVHSYNNCSLWVSHVFCSVSATKLNVLCT